MVEERWHAVRKGLFGTRQERALARLAIEPTWTVFSVWLSRTDSLYESSNLQEDGVVFFQENGRLTCDHVVQSGDEFRHTDWEDWGRADHEYHIHEGTRTDYGILGGKTHIKDRQVHPYCEGLILAPSDLAARLLGGT